MLCFGDGMGYCDGIMGLYTLFYGTFLQTFRRSMVLPPSSGWLTVICME